MVLVFAVEQDAAALFDEALRYDFDDARSAIQNYPHYNIYNMMKVNFGHLHNS